MKETVEERIRALFAEHPIPPMDVIIPILERAGRGDKELATQVYDTFASLAEGIREILGLKDRNMETVAKICETIYNASGEIFEPIELTNARFSSNMSDCPLLHVGKDISLNAKSRFCDLICTTGSKAVFNTVMEPQQGSCTWDKALIKGAGKCTVVFELGNTA